MSVAGVNCCVKGKHEMVCSRGIGAFSKTRCVSCQTGVGVLLDVTGLLISTLVPGLLVISMKREHR